MRNLLFFAVVAAGGWMLLNHVGLAGLDPCGVGTVLEGSQVLKADGDVETRLIRIGSLDETWMLFGGDTTRRRNQATDVSFAGLPLEHARAIAARHPDFHLCRSPGAADAKRLVQRINVIAADLAPLFARGELLLAERVEIRDGRALLAR